MKERAIKIDKKITTIMEETGLTRPTINKFLDGDFDGISVGVMKKLCKVTDTNVFIFPDRYAEDRFDVITNIVSI